MIRTHLATPSHGVKIKFKLNLSPDGLKIEPNPTTYSCETARNTISYFYIFPILYWKIQSKQKKKLVALR